MSVFTKYMDGDDIARQIQMERQTGKKCSFLLLEGDTDIRRFERYVDERVCNLVNCYGRKNAIRAIELLYEDGFAGTFAVLDADFDRVTGSLKEHEGIAYSQYHDLDLDWSRPTIVGRYLLEVGDKTKYANHGSPSDIVGKILAGLKPISVARFLNHRTQSKLKLSDINVARCFNKFNVDIDHYIEIVFERRTVAQQTKDDLKTTIISNMSRAYDLWQLTNGHDFYCALGVCLQDALGSRAPAQTWGKEVEAHLRLACDETEFRVMTIYAAIRNWTRENAPFRILLPHLG